MATPHKCPVCSGSAFVKASFYKLKEKGYVACKSCLNGIIWDYQYTQPSPYVSPPSPYDKYWIHPTGPTWIGTPFDSFPVSTTCDRHTTYGSDSPTIRSYNCSLT